MSFSCKFRWYRSSFFFCFCHTVTLLNFSVYTRLGEERERASKAEPTLSSGNKGKVNKSGRHSPCEVRVRRYVRLQFEKQLVPSSFVAASSDTANTGPRGVRTQIIIDIVFVDFIDLHCYAHEKEDIWFIQKKKKKKYEYAIIARKYQLILLSVTKIVQDFETICPNSTGSSRRFANTVSLCFSPDNFPRIFGIEAQKKVPGV